MYPAQTVTRALLKAVGECLVSATYGIQLCPWAEFESGGLAGLILIISLEYPPVFESLGWVLKGAPSAGSITLLNDFNDCVTLKGMTGRNEQPNMNQSGVQLLDLCVQLIN